MASAARKATRSPLTSAGAVPATCGGCHSGAVACQMRYSALYTPVAYRICASTRFAPHLARGGQGRVLSPKKGARAGLMLQRDRGDQYLRPPPHASAASAALWRPAACLPDATLRAPRQDGALVDEGHIRWDLCSLYAFGAAEGATRRSKCVYRDVRILLPTLAEPQRIGWHVTQNLAMRPLTQGGNVGQSP